MQRETDLPFKAISITENVDAKKPSHNLFQKLLSNMYVGQTFYVDLEPPSLSTFRSFHQ